MEAAQDQLENDDNEEQKPPPKKDETKFVESSKVAAQMVNSTCALLIPLGSLGANASHLPANEKLMQLPCVLIFFFFLCE